jgi:inner membrane protein
METQPTPSFWQKNKLVLKSFFIGFLILLLLIPTFFIMFLVTDREHRQREVVQEVSSKWAGSQTVTGPFLAIPYYLQQTAANNQVTSQKKYLCLLPDVLNINGKILPQIKHRSIFKVPVYNSNMTITGKFTIAKPGKLPVDISSLYFEEAVVCMGITDFKGIGENLQLKWNDTASNFETGLPDLDWLQEGISNPIKLTAEELLTGANNFSISLSLKGSEQLYVTPFGNTTKVHFESDWPNPAFDGKYLPDTSNVSGKGFSADWKVLHYNRSYPQYFTGTGNHAISESAFGINLLQPVDAYGQTMRSVKYAILIIALTFFVYFFLEIYYRRQVHPLQYILIGFALVIFYTLLLSFSEYIAFALAYLVAAAATVLLISWYTKSIFKDWSIVLLFAFILSLLYLFIYVIIQLQDNALLFGSIGLFVLLAMIMYFSRKVNWNSEEKPQLSTAENIDHSFNKDTNE